MSCLVKTMSFINERSCLRSHAGVKDLPIEYRFIGRKGQTLAICCQVVSLIDEKIEGQAGFGLVF